VRLEIATVLPVPAVTVAGSGKGVFSDKNVGTDKAVTVSGYSLSGADAVNYTLIEPTGLTANIAAAPLTVAANDAIKAYDGIAYSGGNGVTYSGFVAGQSGDSLSGTLTYGGTSQGAINIGSYTIVPGGLSSGNYAITFVNGILTVGPAGLAIANNEAGKLIGATTYSGSLARQAATSTSGTVPYNDASQGAVNTGTYTLVSGGLPSDTYSIGYVDGTLTIAPDGKEIR
jgi:MBG domain (YGX type)/YDG domain